MSKGISFLWLDYETGGLNGRLENGELGMEYYPIFEVAAIVTDSKLNQIGEPLRLVIHQSEESIAKSHQWALNTHTESGLLDEVRSSKLSLKDAEHAIISHLQTLDIPPYNRKEQIGAILAGSSIMFDRTYMMCQMPELNDYLHYRQLDVSAFNIAARVFRPELAGQIKKEYKHEALADIQETIDEFKVYRDALFGDPDSKIPSDKDMLDFLDDLNADQNQRYKSNYGWQVDINHNRVSLNDMGPCNHRVRLAIADAMVKQAIVELSSNEGDS